MSKFFKFNMLITSFLPLWFCIFVYEILSVFTIFHSLKQSNNFIQKLILCLANSKIELSVITVILFLNIVCMVCINIFIGRETKTISTHTKYKVIISKKERTMSSEFLLAYILPMIAFDFSDKKDIVLFVAYFLLLAYLCLRNNNIYANVFFEFKKYKMYRCTLLTDVATTIHKYEDCLVISKTNLNREIGNEIICYDFDIETYLNL